MFNSLKKFDSKLCEKNTDGNDKEYVTCRDLKGEVNEYIHDIKEYCHK